MKSIPCMEAVVRVLESEGVDTVFGIPGAAILPLYAALQHSTIRHITVRHEEGGTHSADGWARVTGNVGVCIGTSGPAGTNMITGLYTALADSIPIICITGQAAKSKLHQESFQAVDIVEIAKPVTKWAVQLKEPAQAAWVFREAFRIARSGRPGPVLIDLPIDVQRGLCNYDPALDAPLPVEVPQPRAEPVRAAIEMLLAAERPLILAGGGVIVGDATDELRGLAEHLGIPVQVTLMGKGAFPEDHDLFAGMAGLQTQTRWGNAAFLESDCVLAVGARFGDRHTGDLETYRRGRKFIHVDIEPTQLGKVFEPDLGIVGHARPTLAALAYQAKELTRPRTPGDWPKRIGELRETLPRRDDFDDVPIKPPRVYRELNEFYPPDTTFVTAIGLYQIWSGQFQRTYLPRRYLVCGQAGPLGWEIPAAIGVKCAYPERTVVAVCGDYSFQFLMEEVAVAAQYEIPFVIVMINNEYLGLIRQAEIPYDMNFAVDLHYGSSGIDHVKVMDAFGCPAVRVEEPGKIREALAWATEEAERARKPVLVEVMVEREANAAMGASLDAIKEFEPAPELAPAAD
ncbi:MULTISPECIES: glyoxylate carboligase [unclassified Crossiella]|uniref:glyoxylate carboligase n=1 Tax=unclassified Crossiella TaxID=2620835 RepID=UPI001FFF26A8|nr:MULTISPECIES: glyoxylate carboligase [unclassified Crossiella]MCK2242711.1 glyoxylate carboligase [Crossiella sp. S99.2]MCK2256588.1 glyoxylate carboligase [Crossiella sp. S99.1]